MSKRFVPFPRNSVNLVVGPTSSGKTYFVTQLLNNYKIYFDPPVGRIFIILCNERVGPMALSSDIDVPIEVTTIHDFEPSFLQSGDIVIIDDFYHFNDHVRNTINVCAHHENLSALFILTHAILSTENFELLQLIHRVFLIMKMGANANLGKFIVGRYYRDPTLKEYLHQVLNFVQRMREVVCLEINPIGSSSHQTDLPCLAMSHLTHLAQDNFCLVYPYPQFDNFTPQNNKKARMDNFRGYENDIEDDDEEEEEEEQKNDKDNDDDVELDPKQVAKFPYNEKTNFPQPTFVAVPVSAVLEANRKNNTNKSGHSQEKRAWLLTNKLLNNLVSDYFYQDKYKKARNVLREVLRNPDYCITQDGRYFFKNDNKEKTKVSLLDFLTVVLRKAGPRENVFNMTGAKRSMFKLYSTYVSELIDRGAPVKMFENRLLLPKHLQ